MQYLGALVVLLFCSPVIFMPSHMMRPMIVLAVIALAIGAFGLFWPKLMPATFMQQNPWAVNSPLDPSLSLFFGGALTLFAIGIGLCIGLRILLLHLKYLKPR